ncbi:hypothetical protein AWB66_05865 [Caballeronia telluris]|uniref:Uncharacterized protein n=1 Tax=Caballeronia telluris TaxID=326475 RepID=A0A158KBS1_9BURK|nr:hypothetical protein AWB66_05865 [Caballeronia telluris]
MTGSGAFFVGQVRLHARSSEFDVERHFTLIDTDIATLTKRFRSDRRAGPGIQLAFLRGSGRTLDHVG